MEWHNHYNGQVCVSFSGGKDSTVLLHIARQMFPDIPAVFSNTGLEYPEIQRFVKSFDNVDIVTPSMNFGEVISTYGYPLIGKEVAEAIYYARRIRPSRERERERDLEETQRTPRSTAERKQGELLGYRATGRNWNWGGEEQPHPDEYSEKQKDSSQREMASRDSQWKDWRRGCL